MEFFDLFKNKKSGPENKDGMGNGRRVVYGVNQVYPNTPGIKTLLTKEPPRQILEEDFPKHRWPVRGGWGYIKEDRVILELDNEGEGVAFEYKFLQYRTFEETIVFRTKENRLAGLRFELIKQALVADDFGRFYDHIRMKVHAFTERDFIFLKSDWETHDAFRDDREGRMRHLELAASKRISFEITGWFDVSNFYGKAGMR